MGNNQIYRFCSCAQNEFQIDKDENKSREQVILENGKMEKRNDEDNLMKFKVSNLNSIQDEKPETSVGILKKQNNNVLSDNNSNLSVVIKIELGNGDYYEGNIKNGLYNGEGRLKKSGIQYTGNFKNGKKDGKGEIFCLETDKILYAGNFRNDEKHGKGVETFPDGSVYDGEYYKGLKQGKGRLEISGDKYYIGDFNNDKIEGFGNFVFSDKKYCQGEWKNNELSGLCIFYKEDKIHKGYYKNNKKNGLGCIYYIKNKSSLISEFIEDFNDGTALLIDNQGTQLLTKFSKGKMISTPKPIEENFNDPEYIKLKNFFENVAINLEIKNHIK